MCILNLNIEPCSVEVLTLFLCMTKALQVS